MKLHEYQAKALFRQFDIPAPRGIVTVSPRETMQATRTLSASGSTGKVVLKSQVHAGGRGKGIFLDSDNGAGVRLANSPEQARDFATAMLGHTLRTAQTGAEGVRVRRLLVEEGLPIAREFYLGLTLDRRQGRVGILASAQGGMDIEELAVKAPEALLHETVDPAVGMRPYQARKLAVAMGLKGPAARQFERLLQGLYRLYESCDATLCEINPLVQLQDGALVALDGKVTLDDNALERHPELVALRDIDEEDENEAEAKEYGLSYITLSGNIGCLVNGAGLAMATMDTIQLAGGRPANFLDVGGGASREKVTQAFKLILRDPNIKAILVNIFGGIMKCDVIAEGIIAAAREIKLGVPLVVRLEGTNVEKGKRILAESGLAIIPADHLREAAEKAVAALKGGVR